MKKVIVRSLKILISLILVVGIAKGWHFVTGGFQMHKIREAPNYELPLHVDDMDDEISKVLDQKFHYFSKGCQAYVFESEDGKYVLKFFRHHKYRTPFWMQYFTGFDWGKKIKQRRVYLRKRAFAYTMNSYHLASTHLREETGTVFAHLRMTDHLKKKLMLQDRIGRKWNINLDNRLFILQKKADMSFVDALYQTKNDNDISVAEKLIDSYFGQISKMMKKGIVIRDYNCVKNLAVDKGEVCIIDLGSFYWFANYKDPKVYDDELRKFSKRLIRWCKGCYPELLPILDMQMDQTVSVYYNEREQSRRE